jgi:glutamate-1-semialdehyde 2,1-aminomutase
MYADTVVVGWNDLAAVERVFAERGSEVAAVLTEPIACNYGVIEPTAGYLPGLRDLCDRHGALLIFDEVQTGVRISLGGAQGVLGVTPDITCLGKSISGGVPASVIGGRRDVMELIADRRVFQSGTYNTNPLCLAAIPVVLDRLADPGGCGPGSRS